MSYIKVMKQKVISEQNMHIETKIVKKNFLTI